ncbi:MAG: SDR family oxidoreductase [Pseudomonadota bacterium]
MRVMVTGHKGYVGSVLLPLLHHAGHATVGVDADFFRECSFSDLTPAHREVRKDIRDLSVEDFEGIDAVIHLAALSNDPLGEIDADLTHAINTRATVDLAHHAKAAGVGRFVFSSSCSSYGASDDGWLTETSPLNPLTPYAVSKVRAEEELDTLADDGFSPVFLRSGTAYGLSPRLRADLVANNLTAYAVATGEILMKSDGTAWRPLVHVEDMGRAFLAALSAPRETIHREVFNVGRNSDCMQIRDLAGIIGTVLPEARIEFAAGKTADNRTYRVDCGKIADIGFLPQRNLPEAVSAMAEAFGQARLTEDEFEGPRYVRLSTIKDLIARGQFDAGLREIVAA